jgi:hypothetical protein
MYDIVDFSSGLILKVYKKDLVSRGIITAEQERTLFSNVEELEELNRCDVLSKFEARFRAVQETGASLAVVNLGDIFLQLVSNPFFLFFHFFCHLSILYLFNFFLSPIN